MSKLNLNLLIIITSYLVIVQNVNIQLFGAVPNQNHLTTHIRNAQAIHLAFKYASKSLIKQVYIPTQTYYTMPIKIIGMNGITLMNFGRLVASQHIKQWPLEGNKFINFVQFYNCTNMKINGGIYDGKGYHWWVLVIQDPHKIISHKSRPHLLQLRQCLNCSVQFASFFNSPMYHINILDSKDIIIGNVNITVNRTKQHELVKAFKIVDKFGLQMFPFNTDGIDPQAENVHIYNITSINYNDIVVIKAGDQTMKNIKCSQNILIQNITSYLGSGLSIGTLKPTIHVQCIRNITFRNAIMHHPYKGLYIKHFPGTEGSAIIQNINYQNIIIKNPIYWPIYLGPHRDGPGCMNMSKCTADPKLTIKSVSYKDINIQNPKLYPYMILCNQTNPCENITMQRVNSNNWLLLGKQRSCWNAQINVIKTNPNPNCEVHKNIRQQYQ